MAFDNPAAIAALMTGDIENAVVAATPGGIAAQERAGQAALVANGARLPIDMGRRMTREMLVQAWGIEFHENVDDLFVRVTLPAGWKVVATTHSMWSRLNDAEGHERAGIFYKAAFYERNAHISFNHRYAIESVHESENGELDSLVQEIVRDRKTRAVLFDTEKCEVGANQSRNAAVDACRAHLTERFPDWQNPLAYWND